MGNRTLEKFVSPIPINCPDCCRTSGLYTLNRNPARDRYSESGKLMWEAYTCSCGYLTLQPVGL